VIDGAPAKPAGATDPHFEGASQTATSGGSVLTPKPLRAVHRAREDIRALYADEVLDLGDVVPGWSPPVGDFFV